MLTSIAAALVNWDSKALPVVIFWGVAVLIGIFKRS